jgi:hypothetical protein
MKANILKCSYGVMPISLITKAKELKLYLYICYLSAYGLNTSFSVSVTTISLTEFTDQEVNTIIFMLSMWSNS